MVECWKYLEGCEDSMTPKTCFRKNALTEHPDKGGSEEDFQNLSECFIKNDKYIEKYGPEFIKPKTESTPEYDQESEEPQNYDEIICKTPLDKNTCEEIKEKDCLLAKNGAMSPKECQNFINIRAQQRAAGEKKYEFNRNYSKQPKSAPTTAPAPESGSTPPTPDPPAKPYQNNSFITYILSYLSQYLSSDLIKQIKQELGYSGGSQKGSSLKKKTIKKNPNKKKKKTTKK